MKESIIKWSEEKPVAEMAGAGQNYLMDNMFYEQFGMSYDEVLNALSCGNLL